MTRCAEQEIFQELWGSNRIASIAQSGGSQVAFNYVLAGGDQGIHNLTHS
jgi:hypothetical protein